MVDEGYNLSNRFLELALSIVKLTGSMDSNYTMRHIGKQLLRSGTSPGANYEEAYGAGGRADFIHEMHITLKELKETRYWLRILNASNIGDKSLVNNLISESDELVRIVAKSIITSKKGRKSEEIINEK